jgi:hypothetical protein
MKRYDVRVSCLTLVILALLCATHVLHANTPALAAGPGLDGELGQSTQPTSTHQIFAPVVSGGGDSSPDASVPASSALPAWLLGAGVLVVLVGAYLVLQLGKRDRQ